MSNFKFAAPVLPANDLKAEIEFFEALGFELVYSSLNYSDKLDYAVVVRETVVFHIQFQFKKDMPPANAAQQVRVVVENLDLLQDELKERGFKIKRRDDTAWGTNEFGFYSPANNAIIFQEDID